MAANAGARKSAAIGVSEDENWRDYSLPALPHLLQSSLDRFVEAGYHGTTIRVLANSAEMSVPGLYHHYESKQAIIVEIMRIAMDELYRRSVAALAEAGDSVQAKFDLQIECLVLFHAYRSDMAFVASTEIRSLESQARTTHIAARDRQQRILDDIIEEGMAEGLFRAEDAREVGRAIVTMCTGVAQWYKRDGALAPEQLAARYVLLAQRALGQQV